MFLTVFCFAVQSLCVWSSVAEVLCWWNCWHLLYFIVELGAHVAWQWQWLSDNDTCDAWDFVMSGYVSHGFCFAVQSPLCVGNIKWHFCGRSRIFLLLSVKRSWGQVWNWLITRVAQGDVVAVSGSVDQSGSELKFSADEAAKVCCIFVCETWAYVAWCWDDYELQVDNSLALFDWIEFENGCHALVALQVTS